MTLEKLRSLSDEELFKISLKKNKKGCYTIEANRAMAIRRERHGHWDGISRKAPSFEAMLIAEKGTECFEEDFD